MSTSGPRPRTPARTAGQDRPGARRRDAGGNAGRDAGDLDDVIGADPLGADLDGADLDAPAPPGASSTGRRRSGWLLLIYRVPSEPTRLRATVWRRVRGLGAIYLQSSTAALPDTPANERGFRGLRQVIREMDGTAVLLRCRAIAGEAGVVEAFQAARNDEYEEIVDRARDFLTQVDKEHEAEHYTYAELEENEVDLAKLQSWLDKVRQRDVFGASGLAAVEDVLVECEHALEAYAAQVYARESEEH